MAERPAFRFAPLAARHIPGVLAVERKLFSNPWQASAFRAFLGPGIAFARVALVADARQPAGRGATSEGTRQVEENGRAEDVTAPGADRLREGSRGERVAGYALGWCDGAGAELMNLAVDASWQGCSLGASLLEWVLATCAARGASEIFLEVRSSNERAQRLYRRHGFQVCGRRPAYYNHPREDALVYRAALERRTGAIDSPEPPV